MNSVKFNVCPTNAFAPYVTAHLAFANFGFTFSTKSSVAPDWYIDRDLCTNVGRCQIGEKVSIFTRCVPGGAPVTPDSPGNLRIYSAPPGPLPRNYLLPVETTDDEATGLFRGSFVANNSDFPGRYFGMVSFLTKGIPRGQALVFELLSGGHQLGFIMSLLQVTRPDDDAMIVHAGSGKVLDGRGSYLDEGV